MELGEKDHGGRSIDAAEAPQARHVLAIERKLRSFGDFRVDRAQTLFQLEHGELVLREHDPVDWVLELQARQPAAMGLAPQPAGRVESISSPNEHFHETMAAAAQVRANVFAAAAQVTKCLLLERGWGHGREQARSVELGELARIAAVGLDVFARLSRNERRGDHFAHHLAGRMKATLQRVAARACLVAGPNFSTFGLLLQAAYSDPDRRIYSASAFLLYAHA